MNFAASSHATWNLFHLSTRTLASRTCARSPPLTRPRGRAHYPVRSAKPYPTSSSDKDIAKGQLHSRRTVGSLESRRHTDAQPLLCFGVLLWKVVPTQSDGCRSIPHTEDWGYGRLNTFRIHREPLIRNMALNMAVQTSHARRKPGAASFTEVPRRQRAISVRMAAWSAVLRLACSPHGPKLSTRHRAVRAGDTHNNWVCKRWRLQTPVAKQGSLIVTFGAGPSFPFTCESLGMTGEPSCDEQYHPTLSSPLLYSSATLPSGSSSHPLLQLPIHPSSFQVRCSRT